MDSSSPVLWLRLAGGLIFLVAIWWLVARARRNRMVPPAVSETRSGDPPARAPHADEAVTEGQLESFEVRLHCDVGARDGPGGWGHAWASLHRSRVVRDEAARERVQTDDEAWEFGAAQGEVSAWDTLVEGTPGRVGRREPSRGRLTFSFRVTEAGYRRARAWAASASLAPPRFQAASYNCAHFALELARQAGADVAPVDPSRVAESEATGAVVTPRSLAAGLAQASKGAPCRHDWTSWILEGAPGYLHECRACGVTRAGAKFVDGGS